jgi:uncharacterized metal-binding protein YceD (DUF177 family)
VYKEGYRFPEEKYFFSGNAASSIAEPYQHSFNFFIAVNLLPEITFLYNYFFHALNILYLCEVFEYGSREKMKEYYIAFKGLKDGAHIFEYRLGDAFFGLFEQSLVKKGDLKATVTLKKSSRMLELHFSIEGEVGTICDRCLGHLNIPVNCQETIYVNFGDEYDEPSEELVVLPHEEHSINLAQFMYEFIVVSLPIRHVHPDNEDGTPGCDPEMLAQLGEYMVDENTPADAGEETEDGERIDPRWEDLKKLKNKNNK